jgi:hypothetical protein
VYFLLFVQGWQLRARGYILSRLLWSIETKKKGDDDNHLPEWKRSRRVPQCPCSFEIFATLTFCARFIVHMYPPTSARCSLDSCFSCLVVRTARLFFLLLPFALVRSRTRPSHSDNLSLVVLCITTFFVSAAHSSPLTPAPFHPPPLVRCCVCVFVFFAIVKRRRGKKKGKNKEKERRGGERVKESERKERRTCHKYPYIRITNSHALALVSSQQKIVRVKPNQARNVRRAKASHRKDGYAATIGTPVRSVQYVLLSHTGSGRL